MTATSAAAGRLQQRLDDHEEQLLLSAAERADPAGSDGDDPTHSVAGQAEQLAEQLAVVRARRRAADVCRAALARTPAGSPAHRFADSLIEGLLQLYPAGEA